jgi:hypothetical protein
MVICAITMPLRRGKNRWKSSPRAAGFPSGAEKRARFRIDAKDRGAAAARADDFVEKNARLRWHRLCSLNRWNEQRESQSRLTGKARKHGSK